MYNLPNVVITKIPRWSSSQWFVLGMYLLEEAGLIRFKLKVTFTYNISRYLPVKSRNIYYALYGAHHFLGKIFESEKDAYIIEGYIEFHGQKKTFCIDTADSPYMFDNEQLENVDCYFKCQCPISLEDEGFRLNRNIIIPYFSYEHQDGSLKNVTDIGERKPCTSFKANRHKIHPLMTGPRHLSWGNSKSEMLDGYKNYINSFGAYKKYKLMCYFGSAQGPTPGVAVKNYDADNESSLIAAFSSMLSHPNTKRGKAAGIIAALGSGYDARIINECLTDGKKVKHTNLIVPLEDFVRFISEFEYNLNISGFRMSIPNRFIESFMAGTAILTDKLSVRWYAPWGNEVIETVRMGYEKDEDVDWEKFRSDIQSLPKINPQDIKRQFEEKWSPASCAKYIIRTLTQQL